MQSDERRAATPDETFFSLFTTSPTLVRAAPNMARLSVKNRHRVGPAQLSFFSHELIRAF
ncbi:protein of unknown function [Pararobbsia alpina]